MYGLYKIENSIIVELVIGVNVISLLNDSKCYCFEPRMVQEDLSRSTSNSYAHYSFFICLTNVSIEFKIPN